MPALVSAAIVAYSGSNVPQQAEKHADSDGLRDMLAELTALHRIIIAAHFLLKLNDMLKEDVQAVAEVTHADTCSIFVYEPEWSQLVLTATTTDR